MRVLFVFPGFISKDEQPLGIMYISALLKKHNHSAELFNLTSEEFTDFKNKLDKITERFIKKIEAFKPDLIGFSVVTPTYLRSLMLSRVARQHSKAKIVFGGAHPTVEPERTISEKSVDMICIGEGEYSMLDLVTKMESGRDITNVKNMWIKHNNRIRRNPLGDLVSDLDSLPHPDRKLFHDSYTRDGGIGASFITSRGCPYKCSYCHNHFLQDLYRGKGPYIRYRSIEDVIKEIKDVISTYKIAKLIFSDDMFTLNKKRIMEFCESYQKEVGLPFYCQTRANAVDEEIFTALKRAGCKEVHMGIETGNDYLRNKVLKRNMSRNVILRAFELARKTGLRTGSFNMIGIPYETEKTLQDTININREAKPDVLVCTILMPFAQSMVRQICTENNWKVNEITESYYNAGFIEQPSISNRKLIAYQRLFELYVRAPKIYFPLLSILRFLWSYLPTDFRVLGRYPFLSMVHRLTNITKKLILGGGKKD